MAENQQEQDRNEPATPFKLREAKKRGQVAKSMEINSLVIMSGVLVVVFISGERMLHGVLDLCVWLLSHAGQMPLNSETITVLFGRLVSEMFHVFWPLIMAIVVFSVLSNMAQTGPIFSFFPVKPDFKRLNPAQGLKRLFSSRLLFESGKTVFKMFLFAGLIYLIFKALMPMLMSLMDTSPEVYALLTIQQSEYLLFKFLLVLLIIAFLDIMFVRWEFGKKMRMSRREIKEEVKRREGDPHVRAKVRELQKEAAKRSNASQNVPKADVIITNPTHLSVALKYDRESMGAPQVIAKGAGELALKMRELARRHNIPLVENKPLARMIFRNSNIEEPIPEECFAQVAKILVWVYAIKSNRMARRAVV